MKAGLKIYLIIGMISLNCISCKDMIEPNQPTNQIGSNDVYGSVSTADAVLNNLYAELQYNSVISGGTRGVGALLGSYADDLDNYMLSSQTAYLDIYNTQVLSTNTVIKTLWTNAYKEIYISNVLIEGVNGSSAIKDEDKKRIISEAILVRSLIHLYLSQIFGDIPYVATSDYKINQHIGKLPIEQLLNNLIVDLEYAKDNLKNEYRNTERIYPNRYAALFILSKVHMLKGNWAQARQYADEIIKSSLYQINSDLNLTFKKDGKHIIWQLKPLTSSAPTAEAQLYSLTGAPQNYVLSNNLVNIFDNNDQRKGVWIKEVVSGGVTYYGCYKYKNTSSNANEYSIIFRLEEVYAMMAEILAKQNDLESAIPYLNAIRGRAGLSNISPTIANDAFYNELLLEKRREFFAEGGIRFFDLKHFDRLGDLLVKKPNWKEFRKNWPLPQSEIALNPSLNPQNTGY